MTAVDALAQQPLVPPVPPVTPDAPPPPVEQPAQPELRPFDAVVFEVTAFGLDYLTHLYDNGELMPGLPPVDELKDLVVELGVSRAEDGEIVFGAVVEGGERQSLRIRDLSSETPRRFRWDAIETVSRRVVTYLTTERHGFATVAVGPTSDQILIDFQRNQITDLRVGTANPTALDLFVVIGVVERVGARTLGEAPGVAERPLTAAERRAIDKSPVRAREEDPARSLIRQRELDEFVHRFNRHPGRRLDVALSQGARDGAIELDYLVTENNPLTLYFQTSNTGAADASEFRQRFGLTHVQLTGADDVLNVDYSTSSFDGRSQSLSVNYRRPIAGSDVLWWQAFGSYVDFTSAEIGIFDAAFEGRTLELGGEVVWNFFQRGPLFLDLAGGLRYSDIEVENRIGGDVRTGNVGLWAPFVSVRAERIREVDDVQASVTLTYGTTTGDRRDLDTIGRLESDADYLAVSASASYGFFLEPVLFGPSFRAGTSTLAHRLEFSVRGSSALGSRLIAQEQPVLGGLYSIRGYESAIAAGDNMVMGTVEYRWHIPRSLGVRPQAGTLYWPRWDLQRPFGPRPFRFAPQEPYGRPDWDLALRTFVDVGRVTFNEAQAGVEFDQTLSSVGVGLDFSLYQNVVVSGTWAVALQDVEEGNRVRAEAGSTQFWIVLTLLAN